MRLIDADKVIQELSKFVVCKLGEIKASDIKKFIDSQPTINVLEENKNDRWIKFTSEYSEEAGMDILDCKLPEEDEEILVTDGKHVWEDTFMREGRECYLDGGKEFIVEAIAWMPLPQSYKEDLTK